MTKNASRDKGERGKKRATRPTGDKPEAKKKNSSQFSFRLVCGIHCCMLTKNRGTPTRFLYKL